MLNNDEAEDLREILEDLYGKNIVANWKMNEKVLEVFNDMVERNKCCSVAMDYVPRPITGGRPDLAHIRSQLRGMATRVAKRNAGISGIYLICSASTRYTFRFKFEEAGQGVSEPF